MYCYLLSSSTVHFQAQTLNNGAVQLHSSQQPSKHHRGVRRFANG
jgi:hypothetical protein